MTNLKQRQEKIKEKRKQTPWREFVREIASWMPIGLQKNGGTISRYPDVRMQHLIANDEFAEQRSSLLIEEDLSQRLFSEAFERLWKITPFSNTIQQGNNENTDFADSILNSKNIYLSFGVFEACSNICYSVLITNNCHHVFNSIQVTNYSENIYHSAAVDKSSFIFYSKHVLNSHHVYFCTNMVGCSECIGCDGLENQSYCIDNKQYDKDTYLHKKNEILQKNHTFDAIEQHDTKGRNLNSTNVVGSGVLFSNDIENGYYVMRANIGRNLIFVTGENDDSNLYDCCDCGINGVDFYAVQGGGTNASNYYCASQCESCSDIYYSYYLYNCSFCFGCIGLQNQQYCIFNKQYTKEEWYTKVDEICAQMDQDGTLGKFFPASLNPFYFNDTAAYLIDDSFTKEEVEGQGYLWRNEPIKVDIPDWMEVVEVSELDQYEGWKTPHLSSPQGEEATSSSEEAGEWWIDPAILKKVIRDEEGNVYRVIKMEYDFLMKYGLPLPRKHWLQRLKGHFSIQ